MVSLIPNVSLFPQAHLLLELNSAMARVVLENIRVDFPIYGFQQRSLRTAIIRRATGGLIRREGRNKERILVRALNDVSLRLEEGDRLGLVGRNGSGKSTLLKVIAGIYEPIAGTREVEGRITPLFDMMPGLDPDDSGYENVFTSGMLLGMSRDQVESKIPEIEEFCELGEYLALPVRSYSAGMAMRLGFALVTALEPSVLLMDEGLSVGDLNFTERAAKRMDEFIGRSRIIVLASHSESLIKSMCNKAALLHEGQLIALGPVDNIYEQYEAMAHADAARAAVAPVAPVHSAPERPMYNEDSIREIGLADRLTRSSGAVRITKAVARDESGKSRWVYEPGETVTFRFEYEVLKPVPTLGLGFQLYRPTDANTGEQLPLTNTPMWPVTEIFEVVSAEALEAGQTGALELTLPRLALMPNRLGLNVWLGHGDLYDVIDSNLVLPPLTVETKTKGRKLAGVIFVDYELRKMQVGEAGIHTVTPPNFVPSNTPGRAP
jgi:ABC-type polysaccharide/polyol phosphate transport system ATPase subunit